MRGMRGDRGNRQRRFGGLCAASLILLAAACANDEGPLTDCVVADSRGARWQASNMTPLGAQEAALIACGQQSAEPTTCAVTACRGRW